MTKALIKNKADHRAMRELIGTPSERGTVAGSGVAANIQPAAGVQKAVISFTNRIMALTDVAATVAYVGSKVFDLPAGQIDISNAVADLVITKSSAGVNATWNGDFSVGTVTATNNATLATTEQNIIPTTPIGPAVAGVQQADGELTTPLRVGSVLTPADVYLNILVDDADQDVTGTPCNLIINGTLTLWYTNRNA